MSSITDLRIQTTAVPLGDFGHPERPSLVNLPNSPEGRTDTIGIRYHPSPRRFFNIPVWICVDLGLGQEERLWHLNKGSTVRWLNAQLEGDDRPLSEWVSSNEQAVDRINELVQRRHKKMNPIELNSKPESISYLGCSVSRVQLRKAVEATESLSGKIFRCGLSTFKLPGDDQALEYWLEFHRKEAPSEIKHQETADRISRCIMKLNPTFHTLPHHRPSLRAWEYRGMPTQLLPQQIIEENN